MMCSRVDLPDPEGPTIAHSSPACERQVDAAQGLDAAGVALDDVAQLEDGGRGAGSLRWQSPAGLDLGAHSDSITVSPS